MKRFLIDALIVLIIITVVNHDFKEKPNVTKQVNEFEEEVSRSQIAKAKTTVVRLQDIHENKASSTARKASQLIVSLTKEGASFVSSLLNGIIN